MSWKGWLLLLLVYTLYLIVGGFAFRALEHPDECRDKAREAQRKRDIRDKVLQLAGKTSN